MYGLYLLHHINGQMHVCLIASSIKIITKCVAAVYQPGWFHVETYMHVLGLQLANTASAAAKITIKEYQFYHVLIHIIIYELHNILCLNK